MNENREGQFNRFMKNRSVQVVHRSNHWFRWFVVDLTIKRFKKEDWTERPTWLGPIRSTNQFMINRLISRIEISVNTNISVLGFYGYMGNIEEISVDIFHQISVRQKLSKIDGMLRKIQKMIK